MIDRAYEDKLYRIPKFAGAFRCNVPKGCATRVCRACGDGTACVAAELSGTAYRQGNGSTLCSPTEEKILCRSPFRSGLVSPIFAVPSKGKRKIHKKEKTAGCLLLVPPPGRRHHRWSQRHWHIHTSSIEYIHVKRNRQNCTKCPLNKNEPARRFAALILGCVKGRGFHRK